MHCLLCHLQTVDPLSNLLGRIVFIDQLVKSFGMAMDEFSLEKYQQDNTGNTPTIWVEIPSMPPKRRILNT